MLANSFLMWAVSSLMISAISDSNVLGEAVSLAERVHPIILGTSWDFSSGQLLFSNRSEEHTSELQSRQYLVCRLLLEKKKKIKKHNIKKIILKYNITSQS